jgi:6-phosphogluconolactonase
MTIDLFTSTSFSAKLGTLKNLSLRTATTSGVDPAMHWTRRTFLGTSLTLPFLNQATLQAASDARLWVYLGCYDSPKSKGVYRCSLDLKTGKLADIQLAAQVKSPTFLALHPNGKFLYAVNEISDFQGKKAGGVSAFSIDASGNLALLNQVPSVGTGPCHLTVDRAGKAVLFANYGSGSVGSCPILPDGKLAEAVSFYQHKGTSVDKARQEGPHAHSINVDASNHFAFAADLGLDQILAYKFDAQTGKITPNDPPFLKTPPGGGPRHFTFHPNGKFAFTNLEMTSEVTSLKFDGKSGSFEIIETVSTLPGGKPVKGNSTAEVVVHPNGKFVYVSNRGHNSIALFEVDVETGKLTPKAHATKGIKVPRNFAIEPSGRWMVVANQEGDDVISFEIDSTTGKLTPVNTRVEVGRPVCVRFLARS